MLLKLGVGRRSQLATVDGRRVGVAFFAIIFIHGVDAYLKDSGASMHGASH